jgi:hypothetical protein
VRISNNVVTAGTTHEERETRRRKEYEAELRRQQEYLKRREALRKQQAQYYAQYGGSPYSYGPPSMAYGRRPMGMMGGRGGMGMGLPLMGGVRLFRFLGLHLMRKQLAGGMLLGSAMDGGFGGDYGGFAVIFACGS